MTRIVLVIVAAVLVLWLVLDDPGAMATCTKKHTPDTCSRALYR